MKTQTSTDRTRVTPPRLGASWPTAALTLFALIVTGVGRGATAEPTAQTLPASWTPKLYAYDMEASDTQHRSLAEEARMLRELGFDGVGYLLWLEKAAPGLRMLGEDLAGNLRTLDDIGLPLLAVGVEVSVDPAARPYDPRLVAAMRQLKGRSLTIGVMLGGLAPGDERGKQPAVERLRELGELAAQLDLKISVYHHVQSWAERFPDALRLVQEVNHPRVGVNFNLAHWLIAEGDKDYRPHVRAGAAKIFAVTLNGAKVGGKTPAELIQPLDRGDFDNRELLSILREIGFRGAFGLQCFGIPGDAREHLKRSINVWKTWKAENAGRRSEPGAIRGTE